MIDRVVCQVPAQDYPFLLNLLGKGELTILPHLGSSSWLYLCSSVWREAEHAVATFQAARQIQNGEMVRSVQDRWWILQGVNEVVDQRE